MEKEGSKKRRETYQYISLHACVNVHINIFNMSRILKQWRRTWIETWETCISLCVPNGVSGNEKTAFPECMHGYVKLKTVQLAKGDCLANLARLIQTLYRGNAPCENSAWHVCIRDVDAHDLVWTDSRSHVCTSIMWYKHAHTSSRAYIAAHRQQCLPRQILIRALLGWKRGRRNVISRQIRVPVVVRIGRVALRVIVWRGIQGTCGGWLPCGCFAHYATARGGNDGLDVFLCWRGVRCITVCICIYVCNQSAVMLCVTSSSVGEAYASSENMCYDSLAQVMITPAQGLAHYTHEHKSWSHTSITLHAKAQVITLLLDSFAVTIALLHLLVRGSRRFDWQRRGPFSGASLLLCLARILLLFLLGGVNMQAGMEVYAMFLYTRVCFCELGMGHVWVGVCICMCICMCICICGCRTDEAE